MKGFYGLLLAGGLGVAGMLVNFFYLHSKSKDVEKVYFIGIKKTDEGGRPITISPGERLKEEYLEPVGVPALWAGSLRNYAVPYSALESMKGHPVWRTIEGGSLLLEDDKKMPVANELEQAEDELAWGVPVDSRTFVTSLINPGDMVSFVVSRGPVPTAAIPPTDASDPSGDDPAPEASPPPVPLPSGAIETIGPFKVLSVGTRLGTTAVERASRIPQLQENVLTVAVKAPGGQLEPKAQKLAALLQGSGMQRASIVRHPRKK